MKGSIFILSFTLIFFSCKKKTDPTPITTTSNNTSQEFLTFDFDGKHHSYSGFNVIVTNGNVDSCNGKSVDMADNNLPVSSGQYGTNATFSLIYFTDSSSIVHLPLTKYEILPDSFMFYQLYNYCPLNAILQVEDNLGIMYESLNTGSTTTYYNEITQIKYLGIDVNKSVFLISGNFNCTLKPKANSSNQVKNATNGKYAFKIKVSRI
jgi:hypothetical protein